MAGSTMRSLDRLGLIRPAFRAYEALRSLSFKGSGTAPDGLPMPPAKLRMRVICKPGQEAFLDSGELAARTVRETLGQSDVSIDEFRSILEFGCGCGRVLRHWKGLQGDLAGSDYDPDQVKWCRSNLPFTDVRQNAAAPPLDFGDGQFDFVYSLSVFIHIAPDMQRSWIDEIHRVLAPGGHFLLSTHGAAYYDQMTNEERTRFDRGEFVFRWPNAAGTSLSAGFHPDSYLRELTDEFSLVSHMPALAHDTGEDIYLFRRD